MADKRHKQTMNTSTTVRDRETIRLEDDVRLLWQAGMKKLGSRNKNKVANECLRFALATFATKRAPHVVTEFAARHLAVNSADKVNTGEIPAVKTGNLQSRKGAQ